ncbi:MAG: hypothetical protein GX157_06970 [Candidatus Cloacimonetes bacterium]|nr:hypothetical protein [Candidatus Cloacimonadota bacterium]
MPDIMATIGAIDSSGGAGINQDIRIAALFGFRLLCCAGALTIQDSTGLKAVHDAPRDAFLAALEQINQCPDIRFIKIGALANREKMECTAAALVRNAGYRIILDPVIAPSRGHAFVEKENLDCLRKIAHKAHFICPNIPELEILSGHRISSVQDALSAAQDLCCETGASILLTGGHWQHHKAYRQKSGDSSHILTEAFICKESCHSYRFFAHDWHYTHGTGCTLATAFMCFLAQGSAPTQAFPKASAFTRKFYDTLNGMASKTEIVYNTICMEHLRS